MDAKKIANRLTVILATSEFDTEWFMTTSSLPLEERFEASRTVEAASLRKQILQLICDIEALEK